jgi:hypothetical protein
MAVSAPDPNFGRTTVIMELPHAPFVETSNPLSGASRSILKRNEIQKTVACDFRSARLSLKEMRCHCKEKNELKTVKSEK